MESARVSLLISKVLRPLNRRCWSTAQQKSHAYCNIKSGYGQVRRLDIHDNYGEHLTWFHCVHSLIAMYIRQSYTSRKWTGWTPSSSASK